MAEEKFRRKLTAIFSADVAGYSRLMADDETATVKTLETYREVMSTLIMQHRGRVIDSPGDNLLAEFTSVVDAVQCAVAVQKEFQARNAELPEKRRMMFRIGVNLGDVIEEGERIYGDGVNIAARLEALAVPGGICVSKTAFDHIETKLPLGYEYLGEQPVKNIPKPVGAYRVLMEPRVTVAEGIEKKKAVPMWRHKAILSGGVALAVVVIAALIWHFYFRPSRPPVEVASVEEMASPLPDKPSIAVLPFVNMSGDPEQEYFSDGITEDLITDLSKISALFVIARNSVFAYKGKPANIGHVAKELGVRYVLEGSVRRADKQVRINAQLIDATTGGHLWAERYDGDMGDVFSLQDKITHKIVTALAVRLTSGEEQHVATKETNNIAAYDAFLKGWGHYRRHTPSDFAKAISFFHDAIALDPNYGRAHAALALTHWRGSQYGRLWQESMGLSWVEGRLWAREYLQRAMKNPTSLAHQVASEMACFRREHEEAITQAERAITLDPNDPSGHEIMARALIYAGRPEEALDSIKRAMQLDPHHPGLALGLLGLAHFSMGQSEKAVPLIERALSHNPEILPMAITLTAAYGSIACDQEARATLENVSKEAVFPINLKSLMYFLPFKDLEVAERFAEGLLKAGLPGQPSGYYKVSKENRLTGEEIRDVFSGRTVTGFYPIYGYQFWMECTEDGKTTFRGTGITVSFRSWVDGDMICNQGEQYGGCKRCGPVFRNPESTPEMPDEYLIVYDYGIMPVSPVD
jgi:adenylate cyclase